MVPVPEDVLDRMLASTPGDWLNQVLGSPLHRLPYLQDAKYMIRRDLLDLIQVSYIAVQNDGAM